MILYFSFAALFLFILAGRFFPAKTQGIGERVAGFTNKYAHRLLILLVVFYTVLSFVRLGDARAPVSFSQVSGEPKEYVYDFGRQEDIGYMMVMMGKNTDTRFQVETSGDGETWDALGKRRGNIPHSLQFAWIHSDLKVQARYVRLTVSGENTQILESGFFQGKKRLSPVLTAGDTEVLDEQELVPQKADFNNNTYFDEYFYVTIGYDIFHGYDPYDDDHPPLASQLIALGTELFGMTPFGWRFTANLAGIAMIPLLYLFALKMFRHKNPALFAAFLLTFDFMHFVQSRVAVIEVFAVFFILLAFYLLYWLYQDAGDTRKKWKWRLFPLAGMSLGLAASCKWTGLYAVLAAIPLCAIICCLRYRKEKKDGGKRKLSCYILKSGGVCAGSLFAIPFVVYLLSYLPLMLQEGKGLSYFVQAQEKMAAFHGNYTPKLPFISQWYEWPIVKTPFPYHSNAELTADGAMLQSAITCFGNPLLWWLFIPAFVGICLLLFQKRNASARANALFLFLAIVWMFLPWLALDRVKFIYYFFMHLPFVILALCLCIQTLLRTKRIACGDVIVYGLLILITFAMYYPVLSGIYIAPEYVSGFLKVLESWRLLC